ncbi:phosphonoacetaldehyde hydrolase [Solimicrobium silvestre]|uniref:Phosphonoacetaldehyde hydrolase n=1 Tax=Solimicrobium silvestre TaxID=2099400 RepID=A0A2S9GYH5_9BURK|nr:phosphonoacetaldehyde hydrolase [Solimicrobium silvestre]PRC92777.1 phosphonatase: phosphonoacetaldehyde hydrolase [Solimicrobium silvestre]
MTQHHQDYRYTRHYQGQVQAVIFDWAGTLVDFGSFAPTRILIDAFAGFGITITLSEARIPMGLGKWDHIKALGQQPAVAQRWVAHHGRDMTDSDVDAIYAAFLPLQIARVGEYSDVIPGALEVLADLAERGIRRGSCSGYPRVVMDKLLEHAAQKGVIVEHAVATDDLPHGGRPGPWMALANVIALGAGDVSACVKVDDTTPGIEEGLAAGMWTVGLALSGNEVGLTLQELKTLPPAEVERKRAFAYQKLMRAGAHFVIDTIADLPAILDLIESRMVKGERP